MSTKKTKNFEKGCQAKKNLGEIFLGVSMASPFIATRFECCAFEWLRRLTSLRATCAEHSRSTPFSLRSFYAFGVSMGRARF